MNLRICGLCCCLATGMLFTPAAGATDLYSRPITSASVGDKEGDTWWGPGGSLIPETEWRAYVGRRSALNSPGTFNSWGADPAGRPQLGGTRSSGTAKKSVADKAATAKPVDPCEERIKQALEEAVRTGKIPAALTPSAVKQDSVPAAQAQTGTDAAPVVPNPGAAVPAATAPNPAAAGAARNP